jgi:hypothetical protein
MPSFERRQDIAIFLFQNYQFVHVKGLFIMVDFPGKGLSTQ